MFKKYRIGGEANPIVDIPLPMLEREPELYPDEVIAGLFLIGSFRNLGLHDNPDSAVLLSRNCFLFA